MEHEAAEMTEMTEMTENVEVKEENEREGTGEPLPGEKGADGAENLSEDHPSFADPSVDPARQDAEGRALPGRGETQPDARKRAHDELVEFFELYPDVRFSEIPLSVRESALPLSAAYALYEKRAERIAERARAENERNLTRSAGGVTDGDAGYYTPEEVRRMTREEVRASFDAVMRSMKRWK